MIEACRVLDTFLARDVVNAWCIGVPIWYCCAWRSCNVRVFINDGPPRFPMSLPLKKLADGFVLSPWNDRSLS